MDAREECLLTVRDRECEWTLGSGPLRIYHNVISRRSTSEIVLSSSSSEDERRARVDEIIQE